MRRRRADDIERWHTEVERNSRDDSPEESGRLTNSVISGWNSSSAHSTPGMSTPGTPGRGAGGTNLSAVREGDDAPDGNGGRGGGYFNLSKAGERERFMEVMSGTGAGGQRQQAQRPGGGLEPASMPFELPDVDGSGTDIPTYRMGSSESVQAEVTFPPDGRRHHQLRVSGQIGNVSPLTPESSGAGTGGERLASMADLLDEERSRGSLRLGGRGGRRQGRLNRAFGGFCGWAPSCGVRAPGCSDRVVGNRGTKRRKFTLLIMALVVAAGVAAAVMLLTGGEEDAKRSKSADRAPMNGTLVDLTSGGNETADGSDEGGTATDGSFDLNLTDVEDIVEDIEGMPSRRPAAGPTSGVGEADAPAATPAAVPSPSDDGREDLVPTLDAVAMGVSASPEAQLEQTATVAASTSTTVSSVPASTPLATPPVDEPDPVSDGPDDEDGGDYGSGDYSPQYSTSSSVIPFDFPDSPDMDEPSSTDESSNMDESTDMYSTTSTAATSSSSNIPFDFPDSFGMDEPSEAVNATNASGEEADGDGQEEDASVYGYLAATDAFGSFGEFFFRNCLRCSALHFVSWHTHLLTFFETPSAGDQHGEPRTLALVPERELRDLRPDRLSLRRPAGRPDVEAVYSHVGAPAL